MVFRLPSLLKATFTYVMHSSVAGGIKRPPPRVCPVVRETGVVVIGAGQAGLSSAYHLQYYGMDDYVLLDAADGPGGA